MLQKKKAKQNKKEEFDNNKKVFLEKRKFVLFTVYLKTIDRLYDQIHIETFPV
jgi:hypothetical protein